MSKLNIVYFTDSHISYKTPSSRTDDYSKAIAMKVAETVALANKINADYLICGGDLFHSPNPNPNSVMTLNKMTNIFQKAKMPIYVVPGNHDEFGYSIETLNKTLLGIYIENKVVNALDRGHSIIHKLGDKTISIEGQEYYSSIDKYDIGNFTCKEKSDFHVLVTHSMVTNSKISSYYKKNNVAHIDLSEIKTNANIVLSGHEHNGYETMKIGDTYFSNPGSLGRTDSSSKHSPSVLIVTIDDDLNSTIKKYNLKSAKAYEEVFNLEASKNKKDKVVLLENFKTEINEISEKSTEFNINEIINELIAESNIDEETTKLLYSYIQLSNETEMSTKHIPKNYKLTIKEVEITNFQSHKHTIINFRNGLNSIVGESDRGKTAMLRAIIWCLYNTPRGDEFIRTGAKECSVKVTFSDETYIVRTRTTKSSGSYEVCDVNGEIKTFEGFGTDIPIDVANEHQMPIIEISKNTFANVNISEQLDGPFLLCESSATKAYAIGKITKTDTIDLAIKNISSDMKANSKEIKVLEKQISEKDKELEKYKNLDKDKEVLDKVEAILNKHSQLKQEVDELNRLNNRLVMLDAEINNLERVLSIAPDTDSCERVLQYAKDLYNESIDIASLLNRLNISDDNVLKYEAIVSNSINVDNVEPLLASAVSILNDIEFVLEMSKKNSSYAVAMKNLKDSYTGNLETISALENRILDIDAEIDLILDSVKVCDKCGSEITEENRQYIKNK